MYRDVEIKLVANGTLEQITDWINKASQGVAVSDKAFAKAAARLSCAEELDRIEDLLVDLSIAGRISPKQRGHLHVSYLRRLYAQVNS